MITEDVLAPDPSKVNALLQAPAPENKKEIQSYLALVNFYRRFMPIPSAQLQPLHAVVADVT